jgi:DNA-directed RNA polymerase sigma subunit (sigma70/sigma32)
MTLDEISKRLGLSLVRIKQIEQVALNKVKKRNSELVKELLHE